MVHEVLNDIRTRVRRKCPKNLGDILFSDGHGSHYDTVSLSQSPIAERSPNVVYPLVNMQRTLREHITRLEEKIVVLKRELRDPDLPGYQRSERELTLANAEEALRLFRKAYDLEQRT